MFNNCVKKDNSNSIAYPACPTLCSVELNAKTLFSWSVVQNGQKFLTSLIP